MSGSCETVINLRVGGEVLYLSRLKFVIFETQSNMLYGTINAVRIAGGKFSDTTKKWFEKQLKYCSYRMLSTTT
jgi:hypothetical protein